jgi:tRNA threonylcarbamoyladenosine biosynthesis protein TsaE
MKPESYPSLSQQDTEKIGKRLGRVLQIPSVVLLEGSLGAGKTALTRGIVQGLGCHETSMVHSPTFSLVNQYDCPPGPVYHIDLYRLDSLKDLYSIGLDELLADDAILIIEWAEKLLLPVENPWKVSIAVTGEQERVIEIFPPAVH